jgi:hypothetical protein
MEPQASSQTIIFLCWSEIPDGLHCRAILTWEKYSKTFDRKNRCNVNWVVLYKLYVYSVDHKSKMSATAGY